MSNKLASQLKIPGGDAMTKQALLGDPQPQTPAGPMGRVAVVAASEVPYLTRVLAAPWVGGRVFKWAPFLRTLFIIFVGSWVLSQSVSTMQSMSTSTSAAQNALGVAIVYAAVIGGFYSWRQADMLPIHLHPGITGAEWLHGHLGAYAAVPYMAMNYLGSFLSAPCLAATGGSAIPDYSAALRPASFWGAAGIDMLTGLLFVYAVLQNASILDHLQSAVTMAIESNDKNRAFSSRGATAACTVLFAVIIGYGNGLYTLCNPTIYFGAAWNIGFHVPDAATWTIPIFMCGIVSVTAWAVHLLTWNVQGLTQDEFDSAVSSGKKDF